MVRKQPVSEIIAGLVLLVHVGALFSVWLLSATASPLSASGLQIDKILIPATATYAIGCGKWFIDHQSTRLETKVRVIFVVIVVFVCGGFLGSIPLGLYLIHSGSESLLSVERANGYFAAVEGAFGALFALFYNDLFGEKATFAPRQR